VPPQNKSIIAKYWASIHPVRTDSTPENLTSSGALANARVARQNSCCSQPHFAKTLFSMLRKLAWVLAFILATFCWVVVIEHGPDNFIVGSKIEAENFKSLFFRLIQTPGK
jgi:hypothetical protein